MRNKSKPLALFVCFFLTSNFTQKTYAAAPGIAGTLSVVPGLGQTVDGRPLEGLGWFVSAVGLFFSGNDYLAQAGFDLWQYNMYDAFQGAGPSKRANYNVFQNYLSVANPLNLWDPIGAPVVGVGAAYASRYQFKGAKDPLNIAYYGVVGLGEEGFFRGFLFPGFSDLLFGSNWAGAILSSSAFALAHATGGKSNLTGSALSQRFVFGMLMCWQTHRNKCDLRKSIFAHAWYDIMVSSGGKIEGARISIPF